MSRESPQRRKRCLSLTAEVWNLQSSRQRYVKDSSRADHMRFVTDNALFEQGEWLADGIDSGTKFTGIELIDGEWFDYDEKAGEEVSIKELVWEIRRA